MAVAGRIGDMQDLFSPPSNARTGQSTMHWTPTRTAGLTRLQAFAPAAGRAYARNRNVDRGPGDRSNVSALSPWIRRRLISEEEVVAAVLHRHSISAAEKFIQEVFWRTYWKGWLEMRPDVLTRFNVGRLDLKARLARDAKLKSDLDRATSGETGIACFDAWARELVEIGWLHNHARMWFASIWIFTLNLPWQLGADFFYKHLLDADPASNTLSWRWVAGLHTTGKHYLAKAANIREGTLGRFDPAGQLNEQAPPLFEEPLPLSLRAITPPDVVSERRVAVLLHDDDLHLESLAIRADIVGLACLNTACVGDPQSPAMRFARGACDDGLQRASLHCGVEAQARSLGVEEGAAWAKALGVKEVVTPYAPVGLTSWALDDLANTLAREGVRLVRLRRDFDTRAWPHAKAGYFKFKEVIPKLIAQGGLG
ncbi:MAG: FAD-binding domain-containing protein [Caulobacterales bacterium]